MTDGGYGLVVINFVTTSYLCIKRRKIWYTVPEEQSHPAPAHPLRAVIPFLRKKHWSLQVCAEAQVLS